jgi:hypothetical protein
MAGGFAALALGRRISDVFPAMSLEIRPRCLFSGSSGNLPTEICLHAVLGSLPSALKTQSAVLLPYRGRSFRSRVKQERRGGRDGAPGAGIPSSRNPQGNRRALRLRGFSIAT